MIRFAPGTLITLGSLGPSSILFGPSWSYVSRVVGTINSDDVGVVIFDDNEHAIVIVGTKIGWVTKGSIRPL